MWDWPEYRGERHGASLKHTACRSLYAYWDRLRADRPAPLRREIEPADIGPVLSDTFILEANDDRTYSYRLAGTRVGACFGRELKGENWLDAWPESDREALTTMLRAIVCDAAAAAIAFSGDNGRGQSAPFETLLLPLVNRGKGYTRILGAMLPLDEPYWLGSYPIEELSLSSLKLIWAEKPGSKTDPGNPLRTEPVPIARKKHLTLYDGGRLD